MIDAKMSKFVSFKLFSEMLFAILVHSVISIFKPCHVFRISRPLFCMRGGISCIYRGGTKIMRKGKQVEETGNEVDHLIAYYKELKGNGYQTPFVPMEVPSGDYSYILYDSSPGREFAFAVNVSKH